MTSEKRVQKFHTDDPSPTQIWVVLLIGRAAWEFDSTNQKYYPDLGSDGSSVWNFCARFSDVIWR